MTMFRLLLTCLMLLFVSGTSLRAADRPPNVVIIFLDDAGYADFHPFGNPPYATPHVEALAKEGVRLTRFYVPQAVCSASRSSLMSGCFPGRHRVFGAHGPGGRGLDPKFTTMAEMLKTAGYATAHYGKWHCGDQPETRPTARGFDEHAGLMISNDMWRHNPVWAKRVGKDPLPFWENGKVKIADVGPDDQKMLTQWATQHAVDFIGRHRDRPFFVYLAHSMPHVPLYCSDAFAGKSGAGMYGDVMTEIDWSVGEVRRALHEAGVEQDTLIVFSSDNGPWSEFGNHAGKTPFREHKGTSFDGGTRSATIVHYPAMLKGGRVLDRAMATVDLFPTIARLAGAKLPEHEIDGRDVWPILSGDGTAPNPHEYYPFSIGNQFEAVISGDGRWKLQLPHRYRHVVEAGNDGERGKTTQVPIDWSLYDLQADSLESENLIGKGLEIETRLRALAEAHRERFYASAPSK